MKKPKVYASDRFYVPASIVMDKQGMKDHYTMLTYDEAACRKCEYREDRHSYLCDKCPAFTSRITLWDRTEIDGKTYYALPIGDRRRVSKVIGYPMSECQVIDERRAPKFTYPVKFLLKLYDYQLKVIEDFMEYEYGLLESPPRSGKTAMFLAIAIRLGYRCVIMADQHDFLTQFEYHITGHPASNIPKCTNLPELEEKHGVKLYGWPEKPQDWKTIQIFLVTYQKFLNDKTGQARLRKLIPHIGTVLVDEVHSASAECFSGVISDIPAMHKMGGSGTLDRKDGRDWVIKKVIGPRVAVSTVEALTPRVYVHPTGFVPKAKYQGKAGWTRAMQALARDKKRNKMIVAQAIKDVEAGHSVVIPVTFKKHVLELQKAINCAAEEQICEVFVGGAKSKKDRERVLGAAKSGKAKVVVGIRSLMQRGLNVPRWSAIYTVIPISNTPNYKQETSRVRTPLPGKKPIIRLFVDEDMGQSIGCAKHCIADMKKFKYKFSTLKSQQTIVNRVIGARKARTADEDERYSLAYL